MDLVTLCKSIASEEALSHLTSHMNRTNKSDHKEVERFQACVCESLNNDAMSKGYRWKTEIINKSVIDNDRIDIWGKNKDERWIIEIDAARADQVAKKLFSRIAIWGKDKGPIKYVAVLYPHTQDEVYQCKKYVRYGNDILSKREDGSFAAAIFVTPLWEKNNQKATIEIVKFGKLFKTKEPKFRIVGYDMESASMSDCAMSAIRFYIEKHNLRYNELKSIFGKFVSDQRGGSRYNDIGISSSDNIPIFAFSQWREFAAHNWDEFLDICAEGGIIIEKNQEFYPMD